MAMVQGAGPLGARKVHSLSEAMVKIFKRQSVVRGFGTLREDLERAQTLGKRAQHQRVAFEAAVLSFQIVIHVLQKQGHDAMQRIQSSIVDRIWQSSVLHPGNNIVWHKSILTDN